MAMSVDLKTGQSLPSYFVDAKSPLIVPQQLRIEMLGIKKRKRTTDKKKQKLRKLERKVQERRRGGKKIKKYHIKRDTSVACATVNRTTTNFGSATRQ
jgi:hypothetical protein